MRFTSRVVAACVAVALLLSVVPVPVASAQTPAPATPQPDIFTESLKAAGQAPAGEPPAGQPPAGESPAGPPPVGQFPEEMPKTVGTERLPREAYDGMAIVASAFLVPGRAVTCLAGGALGIFSLVLTLGSGYRFATAMVEEGCGGKWTVSAEDLLPDRPMTDAAETR